jgi:hypothetical protein
MCRADSAVGYPGADAARRLLIDSLAATAGDAASNITAFDDVVSYAIITLPCHASASDVPAML